MYHAIDCKKVRDDMLRSARVWIKNKKANLKLVIIQVEGDNASEVYVKQKVKTANEVGIDIQVVKCPNDIGVYALGEIIREHNNAKDVTGLMLQLPLPDHLTPYEQELLDCISWEKDVDGLSSASVGRLWTGRPCITPATPTGVMRLLPLDLSGKNVTIVNRSNLIGKPLTKMLLDRNATVNVCHSKTGSLSNNAYIADIVITGVGKPRFIDYNFYYRSTEPKTWIDCGICRDEDGNLCGDLNLETFTRSYDNVTLVPGGVGILTTAQLMLNVIKAHVLQEAK